MNGIPARVLWVNKRAAINIHGAALKLSPQQEGRKALHLKKALSDWKRSQTPRLMGRGPQSVIGKTTPNLDSVIFPNDIVSTNEVDRPFILWHLSDALPTIPLTRHLLHIRQEHSCFAIADVMHFLCSDETRMVSRSPFDHQLHAYRHALPFFESKWPEVKRRSLAEL
jgi:hypothetical protein